MKRYLAEETIVQEHFRPTSDGSNGVDLPFIDLIVCPSYDVAYNDSQLQAYGLTRKNYRSEAVFSPRNDKIKNMELRGIFNTVAYDVFDILYQVRFETVDIDNRTIVEKLKPSITIPEHIKITTKYYKNFGKCYSIRPRSHVLKLGITIIDIIARMNIFIYLGHPGQFMYNTKTKVCSFYL